MKASGASFHKSLLEGTLEYALPFFVAWGENIVIFSSISTYIRKERLQ